MAFPITAKYFLRFRHSDTGLTPVFSFIKRADTMADVSAPSISPVGNGTYYFQWTFNTKTDPDIVFEVDGGASIPTEEVRYIGDTISPRDYFLDEPTSQVVTDVWGDSTGYSAGTKGKRVDQSGDPTDTSATATLFGKSLLYKESVRGDGAGTSNGNSVKQVYDRTGAPVGASISADLQGDTTTITTAITSAQTSIKGSGNKDLTQVDTHVGTAETDIEAAIAVVSSSVGGLVSPDNTSILAIKAKTDSLPDNMSSLFTAFSDQLLRVLGMLHENSVLDKTTFDPATNNLTSARFRIYTTRESAVEARRLSPSDYDTDKMAEYALTADYLGSNLMRYLVSKEWPLPS